MGKGSLSKVFSTLGDGLDLSAHDEGFWFGRIDVRRFGRSTEHVLPRRLGTTLEEEVKKKKKKKKT